MRLATTVFAGALALAALPAHAIVVGGAVTGGTALSRDGGTFVKLSVPFSAPVTGDSSVGNNTFQTSNLYAFDEDQNIAIPSEITVDIGVNPVAGDIVASHYVFFDPGPSRTMQGYVDFDAPIYGVATATDTLADSDFLALASVTYLNPGLRGLESFDSVSIDPMNAMRLLIDVTASTPGDYVRVFTMESPGAQVPLPAAGWLLLGGLGALGALRRRA